MCTECDGIFRLQLPGAVDCSTCRYRFWYSYVLLMSASSNSHRA